MISATGLYNYSTPPAASHSAASAAPMFGHATPHYPHNHYQPDSYHQAHGGPRQYSIGERLQLGLKNALNGKNLRKSFFRSLLLFLLTLPTAAIIPGPQLLVIPTAMGIGATLRFLKGLRNPAKVAQTLANQ